MVEFSGISSHSNVKNHFQGFYLSYKHRFNGQLCSWLLLSRHEKNFHSGERLIVSSNEKSAQRISFTSFHSSRIVLMSVLIPNLIFMLQPNAVRAVFLRNNWRCLVRGAKIMNEAFQHRSSVESFSTGRRRWLPRVKLCDAISRPLSA